MRSTQRACRIRIRPLVNREESGNFPPKPRPKEHEVLACEILRWVRLHFERDIRTRKLLNEPESRKEKPPNAISPQFTKPSARVCFEFRRLSNVVDFTAPVVGGCCSMSMIMSSLMDRQASFSNFTLVVNNGFAIVNHAANTEILQLQYKGQAVPTHASAIKGTVARR